MTWLPWRQKPKGWDSRVEAAQKALGVPPDGLMGPGTASVVLGSSEASATSLRAWYALSDSDRDWVLQLARQERERNRWR